jgi:hypothetical protein
MKQLPGLNPKEQKMLELLEQADKNTLWGVAIDNVLKNPSVSKVRRLICDLKSQATDEILVMRSIIGEEGLNQLMAL